MKKVFALLTGAFLLSSCGVYKRYDGQHTIRQDVFGIQQVDTTSNIGALGWRQLFTDQPLQTLIDQALSSNTEAKTALLRIQQAEAGYKSAQLGYLPNVAFSPSISTYKAGSDAAVSSAALGIGASWQLDVLGATVTNTKRKAKAQVDYAQDYAQAVQSRLIASMATLYYNLEALDQQLLIQTDMLCLYEQLYESVQVLFEAGQYNSAAVSQTRAQLEQLRQQKIQTQAAIVTTEQSICQLLDEPFHPIERGSLQQAQMPDCLGTGVPADLLRLRPDVRVAERNIQLAYYDVQLSKGALYPSITLTANGGWSMLSPAFWFIEGIGSLTQPLFMGGKLRANLQISRIGQEIAVEEFRSTVIRAGHEVITALRDCQLSRDKAGHIQAQVEALQQSVTATRELMNYGSSNYLEVLIAMQDLLGAQSAQITNQAAGMEAVVRLYAALGGK